MFIPKRASTPRHRTVSSSTDDQSFTKDKPRRLFQRHHTHDHTTSYSLANSLHDDLPARSFPTHISHSTSSQSTPMTSPSTGYSSLFPGSLSSTTSEYAPSAESKYRSEFGLLIPGSASAYSAVHGSASSRSSNPISRSRSPTESDIQSSVPRIPRRPPSNRSSNPPITPSTSPPMLTASPGTSPLDHHTRSNSRLTVSIKNIFSRHAIPSPSRFSFNSATSTPPESEASSNSFQVPVAAGKWSMTPRKSRPPDLEISGALTPAIPSPGHGSNTPLDPHCRYPSDAAPKLYSARTGSALPTSQESIDVSPRNIPALRGRDPKTRNVLRRRPSGSVKLFKGRERGMSSPSRLNEGNAHQLCPPSTDALSDQAVPFPLTPAGAVVEAYKQQALCRDDVSSPPKPSVDNHMSSTTSHDDRDQPAQSPTPYYTVFGTLSERHILAGSSEDRWSKFESAQRTTTPSQPTLSHKPSMSDPGGRSLSRKLSNRWRKVKGGVVTSEKDSPSREKGHSRGRSSLHELWKNDKSRSMDGVSNPGDGAWASPNLKHARSASKGDKNEGPNFWRLMRRISTGGLRDRPQSETAVPPVPAIPKELLAKAIQSDGGGEPSRHQPSPSLQGKDHSRSATAPRIITVVRPSIATSSSSPNSSDVASTRFFQKSHSPRSSLSSYGEPVVLPRATEPVLDLHIITPLEQLRLADNQAEQCTSSVSRPPRRSSSIPAALEMVENAETDHPPLPSPHRQTCSEDPPSFGSSRPCSASPSVSGSPHASYQSTSLGQSRRADGIVSLSPPPRPSRNSARGSGSLASSPSHSMLVKQADGVGIGIGGVRQIDRTPSGQSDMTARLGTPESRRSQAHERDRDPEESPRKLRGQFTFRELDGPRRPPLTEREKAAIWNDLLARSDKAGGTLHFNGAAELMSDSMRLSMHSDA